MRNDYLENDGYAVGTRFIASTRCIGTYNRWGGRDEARPYSIIHVFLNEGIPVTLHEQLPLQRHHSAPGMPAFPAAGLSRDYPLPACAEFSWAWQQPTSPGACKRLHNAGSRT